MHHTEIEGDSRGSSVLDAFESVGETRITSLDWDGFTLDRRLIRFLLKSKYLHLAAARWLGLFRIWPRLFQICQICAS
jgi:hypothetical protein